MNKFLYNEPTRVIGVFLEAELHDRAVKKARFAYRTLGNWIVTIMEIDTRYIVFNNLTIKWVIVRLHIDSELLNRAKYAARLDRRSLGQWITVQLENDMLNLGSGVIL